MERKARILHAYLFACRTGRRRLKSFLKLQFKILNKDKKEVYKGDLSLAGSPFWQNDIFCGARSFVVLPLEKAIDCFRNISPFLSVGKELLTLTIGKAKSKIVKWHLSFFRVGKVTQIIPMENPKN